MDTDLAFALRGVNTAVGNGFALRDVSFSLPSGYVMGLIGANGTGKTTTIRCLLGMRAIDSGEIDLLGHRAPTPVDLRQDVGVVLDHTYLVGDWRLSEVERTLRPFYDRWDAGRYRQLLDEFGLDPRAKVKDLSRGMAMKLMIAVALSHRARLLVFDEPTSGLDPVARDELIGTRRTAAGTQALVLTDEAALLDDDVLVEPPTFDEIAMHVGSPAARPGTRKDRLSTANPAPVTPSSNRETA